LIRSFFRLEARARASNHPTSSMRDRKPLSIATKFEKRHRLHRKLQRLKTRVPGVVLSASSIAIPLRAGSGQQNSVSLWSPTTSKHGQASSGRPLERVHSRILLKPWECSSRTGPILVEQYDLAHPLSSPVGRRTPGHNRSLAHENPIGKRLQIMQFAASTLKA